MCEGRIRLEDVSLLRDFSCPQCGARVGTSSEYRSAMAWTAAVLAVLVPYLLGVRSWWVLAVVWFPSMFVSCSLCGYIGKYFRSPRLQRTADASTLGLGPKND